MAGSRGGVRKPMPVPLFDRRAMVLGPVLVADGVIVCDLDSTTVKLDRATLTQKVWEIPSENYWLGSAVADVVTAFKKGTRAYSVGTGALVWEWPKGGGAKVGNYLTRGRVTHLEVFDGATGKLVRTLPMPWEPGGEDGMNGVVGMCGERVIVRPPPNEARPKPVGAYELACVSFATGEVYWNRRGEDPVAPVETEQPAFISSEGIWPVAYSSPARVLLLHAARTVLALDAATGELQWATPVRCDLYKLSVAESRVFVPEWKGVTVLDADSGAVVGRSYPPEMRDGLRPRPAIAYRNRVAVPHESGHLAVYDAADGRNIHVYKTKKHLWGGVEADGRLILTTNHGMLLVFDESVWGFDR